MSYKAAHDLLELLSLHFTEGTLLLIRISEEKMTFTKVLNRDKNFEIQEGGFQLLRDGY